MQVLVCCARIKLIRCNASPKPHMFRYFSPEERVPAKRQLRFTKAYTEAAPAQIRPILDGIYSEAGRPSTPPERIVKAGLLNALNSVRSDQMFCETLRCMTSRPYICGAFLRESITHEHRLRARGCARISFMWLSCHAEKVARNTSRSQSLHARKMDGRFRVMFTLIVKYTLGPTNRSIEG